MKTIKMLLVLFLFSVVAKAQLTLEGSHNGRTLVIYEYTIFDSKPVKYISFNTYTDSVTIYNLDHSIYKQIGLTPPISGSLYGIYMPSTHLFNTDDKIEFLAYFYDGNDYSMQLYNESGNVLQDLGNSYLADIIKTENNQYKLLVLKNSDTYYTEVYTLSGSFPQNTRSTIITEKNDIQPNKN